MVTAAGIIIGDEILSGKVRDTNIHLLAGHQDSVYHVQIRQSPLPEDLQQRQKNLARKRVADQDSRIDPISPLV
jgi:hypothetical protein